MNTNQIELYINNSIPIFQTAPNVLKTNQDRSNKALQIGQDILNDWSQAWSTEDETERLQKLAAADERSNKYLVNCAKALTEEKELRKAITQLMDEFKSMFTAAENCIDKKTLNSIPYSVQKYRDAYVSELNRIQEEKRKAAELQAAKAKDEIRIRAEIQSIISQWHTNLIALKKTQWMENFNSIRLENFEEKSERLMNLTVTAPPMPDMFNVQIQSGYFNGSEIMTMFWEIMETLLPDLQNTFIAEMTLYKEELIVMLPLRHAELKRIRAAEEEAARIRKEEEERQRIAEAERQKQLQAAKDEAEKKRLAEQIELQKKQDAERLDRLKRQEEEEKKRREEEENKKAQAAKEKIAQELAEAQKKSQLDIELKKQGEETMLMFEKEASIADIDQPSSKKSWKINVLHPAGYMQIFSFYFEHEGKDLPVDKLGNMKLDQMKSFCEKSANKTGNFIESKFLKYEVDFKAIAKK